MPALRKNLELELRYFVSGSLSPHSPSLQLSQKCQPNGWVGCYSSLNSEEGEEMGNWGKTEMGNWAMVVLAIVMVATTTMVAEGQGDSTPSCASALVPCSDYLNSTNPPASCCTPLRQTVNTQLKCLCNLLNDKSLFQSLNINMTQALELPKHCGITDTTTACRKFSASASPPSSSDVVTPPPPGVSGNGVRKLAWNGMSLWLVLLAFMVVIRDFFEL